VVGKGANNFIKAGKKH